MRIRTSNDISLTEMITTEEYEAKSEAAFAVLCPYCKHRWGNHAILGCQHPDCKNDKKEGCKYDGIRAIRNMMKDPDFKYTYIPKLKEKVEVQTTL